MFGLPISTLARIAWPMTATVVVLAGCASADPQRPPARSAAAAAAVAPPRPNADFSPALRCMDTMFADYGVRDVSVIVEDLVDQSKRVDGGTRDMLIAVVSGMTQRSRAIRLVASGSDWGKTNSYLSETLKRDAFAVVPQYALRGTISRQDSSSGSVLGVDLTLVNTQDMTVVPGVSARNSAAFARGNDAGSSGELRKLGHVFSVPGGAAAHPQALRPLVELAAIELFGRLAKLPYWTCLGATEATEGVSAEIQDWYDALAAQPAEIIKYFQTQLRMRQVYEGPIDGAVNAALKDAVARYREALGLSAEPKLSLDFFKAYLAADHHKLAAQLPAPAPVAQSIPVAAQPAATAAATPAPLQLQLATNGDGAQFARGEAIRLNVRPNRPAHVYCFLQDENRRITRFFPNRFQKDSRVQPEEGLQLPGAMRFEIFMNTRGVQETVSCFATERDVLPQLASSVNAGDFAPLPVASMDEVRNAFAKVSAGALAQQSLQIRPK